MRIFFIGSHPIGAAGMPSDLMESHILATFTAMGHECAYFPYRTAIFGAKFNRLAEYASVDRGWISSPPVDHFLLRRVAAFAPDLVLTLLGNYTSPATIRAVRKVSQAPIVCWCQDHMGTMGRQYVIGSGYDFLFAKDLAMVELLQRYTQLAQVHYLPEACNPAMHRPVLPTPEQEALYGCEVTTAASLYYYRSAILESIADFDLKIWGTYLRYYQGPLASRHAGGIVFGDSKAACFRVAKIVLNTLYPTEINGLNARAFEAAGCGGFQLINDSPAISRHFVPGQEIEVFRNLAELREKIRYYLDHDSERLAIADAGARRAQRDHTYEIRLQEILNTVFGQATAAGRHA
jgi:spore maturation protein CgeB